MNEWIRPDALGAFWATMAGDEPRAREHLGNLPPPDLMTFHQDLQALLAWVEEGRGVPPRADDPHQYNQVTLRLSELRAVVDTLAIVVAETAGGSIPIARFSGIVHRGDLEAALSKLRRDLERRGGPVAD